MMPRRTADRVGLAALAALVALPALAAPWLLGDLAALDSDSSSGDCDSDGDCGMPYTTSDQLGRTLWPQRTATLSESACA